MAIKSSEKSVDLNEVPELDKFKEDLKEFEEESPEIEGEQDLGGTTVNLDKDDDTLEGVHGVGHQPDEDLEHPQPLDPAGDTEKAEDYKRNH